jgi:hypothetical protein
MLKKWWLVGVMIICIGLGSLGYAQENNVSGGFGVDAMSNYIWRGSKLSDSAVVQLDLNASYKGFTVDFWANYDAGDTGDVTEVDITFDYSRGFKVGPGELTASVGYIYYDTPPDTQEIYLGGSYGLEIAGVGLNAGLTIYRDIEEFHSTYVEGSVGADVEVKPATVSPYLTVSYSSKDDNDSGWNNIEIGVDTSFPITGPLSGHALVAYSVGNEDLGLDNEFYGGVGISFEF